MKHPKFSHSFEVEANLPEPLRPLVVLAHNLRWSWHHGTQALFREMDKALWRETGHNPVELINRLTPERIARLLHDTTFMASLKVCAEELDGYLKAETWFDREFPGRRDNTLIAYFCAEFGVSESLPIYSGGLGVLAGDHLKAASDLGLPLVGVGLLYSRGYFRQQLSFEGWQQEEYPQHDFFDMPLELVRGADMQPIQIQVENEHADRPIICQVWKAQVGRVPLYLLDSNVLENEPNDQSITDTLYGGDAEIRIRQEAILGAGGLRALRAIGVVPTVCHMNEGHSAFLVLDRIRQFMQDHSCDHRLARKVIVAGNVFTTHTPVPAGFDVFEGELLKTHVARLVESCGVPWDVFLKMGGASADDKDSTFNMAVLAIENSNHVNAVSILHSDVAREMFHSHWPGYPEDEVPIEAITNGVHTQTWVSTRMAGLFDTYLGPDWRENPANQDAWKGVWSIPDSELWEARENQRGDFVRYVRRRVLRDIARRGMGRPEIGDADGILDPRILTVGFARRFATYKRASLLLADHERVKSLIQHPEKPMQFVFAGKSHPKDDAGKKIIQDIIGFIRESGLRSRMVFLEDYDIGVARAMVQGVDVWLNNPRRPNEASGTSGMKVVPNGGLNLSVLDGWWDEAYQPGLGWAIGDRREYSDPAYQDWADGRMLYHLLENEVSPRFYGHVSGDPPAGWCEMIKRSIYELAPRFSTARMVSDYAKKFYLPASQSFNDLKADGLSRARAALPWRERIKAEWPHVKILDVCDTSNSKNPLGFTLHIRARVELGSLNADEVRVEAVLGSIGVNRELRDVQPVLLKHAGADGSVHAFEATAQLDAPGHKGYAVRVSPYHPDVDVPVELNLVSWEGS